MSQIIVRIRKGEQLSDEEMSIVEAARKDPKNPGYIELYLAGLV